MKKVITYGTYDLLHYGHIRLLERAKALGDYLIVGVTSDDFDKRRGKINVVQSLAERIKAVKETGLADEIIVEEYEGQKIDDIINYGVDVFTLGSDWEGKFDYLREYCEVVYLPRTEGVSSTDIRSNSSLMKLGLLGPDFDSVKKVLNESKYVNGLLVENIFIDNKEEINDVKLSNSYDELIDKVDAVYITSHPSKHYSDIKKALSLGKHVLCEGPICTKKEELEELFKLAESKKLVLMEANKTAFQTAYTRLLLLLKGGVIGNIVSVDATCTSLQEFDSNELDNKWNTICDWGKVAMLPVFQILGTNYKSKNINSMFLDKNKHFDTFTKIDFTFDKAVASIKVGTNVKSEGELIVSGTKGYLYVPAPWWKADYFEIRYENTMQNKKYFYELSGEGIRNELVSFLKAIKNNKEDHHISKEVSFAITSVIEDFYKDKDVISL